MKSTIFERAFGQIKYFNFSQSLRIWAKQKSLSNRHPVQKVENYSLTKLSRTIHKVAVQWAIEFLMPSSGRVME